MATPARHAGDLVIDHEAGTIQFIEYGVVILSITHFVTPMPIKKRIELVALPALTSYVDRDLPSTEDRGCINRE